MESASRLELADDGLERVLPLGQHLDLDPAQLHWPLALTDDHHGVVEGEFGGIDAGHPQDERTPAGADLEDLAHAAPTSDGMDPATHGPFATEAGEPVFGEVLGDFEPLAQGHRSGRSRVFQRDFVVAAPRAGAQHEPGPHHPPVLGIEIRVDHSARGRATAVIVSCSSPSMDSIGRVDSQRSTGRRSSASNGPFNLDRLAVRQCHVCRFREP